MAQTPDFKVDLERSPYIRLREYLLTNNEAPKLSHANKNLGTDLANLVFQHCDEALKEDFGLTRPLKGPGDDLWTSPSDLLLGKLALKPPFTPKCLQALTHRGILEIGYGLEKKFREEMEMDKQRCLEAYKEELLASVEARMKSEIKDVEIRERLNCHMELEKQTKEFEVNLKNELKVLEEKLLADYDTLLKNQEENLKEKWADIMKDEVEQTAKQMTQEFLQQLDEQEEILTKNFSLELRKREALRTFDAKMHQRKTVQALRQLKHNLECTNLVNMMYILCTERQKCCHQKERIENYYKNEVHKLQRIVEKKNEQLAELELIKAQKIKEIQIREILLTEILKQFQKFINFALKSAPTQAEFLLSVEKMMVFELTNAVTKKEFLNLTDENAILAWKHSDQKSTTSSEASSLRIKDFHDCCNELEPPQKDDSDGEPPSGLPVVYFKDKRYIREEFRDLLVSGVELKPSHELWSRDVQILIDSWREEQNDASAADQAQHTKSKDSIKKDAEEERIKQEEMKHEESVNKLKSATKSLLRGSMGQKSNVQFRTIEGGATAPGSHEHRKSSVSGDKPPKTGLEGIFGSKMDYGRWSVCSNEKDGPRKLSFRKTSLKPNPICRMVADVEFEEKAPKTTGSKLLGVRDSLEMIKEKSKTRYSFLPGMEYHHHPQPQQKDEEEIFVEFIHQRQYEETEEEKEDDKLKTLKTFEKDFESGGRQSNASEEIILETPHVQPLSPSKQDLALETKDSIILQKISLVKKASAPDFNASLVDSVELTKDNLEKSVEGIRSKSSKLTSARNSVTLLKESLAKLHGPSPICHKKNRDMGSSQSLVDSHVSACCEKCKKEDTHSHAGFLDEDKSEKSVKISRIEVISLDQQKEEAPGMRRRTNSAVSFQKKATVYEALLEEAGTGDAKPSQQAHTNKKSLSAKSSSRSTVSKTKKGPTKPLNYYDAYPPTKIQVLGDQQSPEGVQSVHEFTAERIHSLVNLMKGEPYLMQLFTACRR